MRRQVRAVAAAALLALVACSGGEDQAGPSATVGTEPPQTTTTDPYAIPPVIDDAYVNRVLAGLDAAMGDVVRLVVRTKDIPPEAIDRLKSVYGIGEGLQPTIDLLQNDMRNGFASYVPNPGNPKTIVKQLISSDSQCIFAAVSRDYSAVTVAPGREASNLWIALKPIDSRLNSFGYNPTSWFFAYDGFEPGRTAPSNPCTGA